MRLPVEIEYRKLKTDELMLTFSPEEVLGYCQHCNNYGMNHSCPAFPFDTETYLSHYDQVILILTHIRTDPIKEAWQTLKESHFDSPVGDLHMGTKDEDYDPTSAVSMKAFNMVKDLVSDLLLEAEKAYEGLSSPPGSCTRCDKCLKTLGEPCIYPDKLRHSLEALGFKVNDIYDRFFGIELEWTKGTLPKAFHTCNALFIKEDAGLETLKGLLNEELKEINI